MKRFDQAFTKVSDRLALYASGLILLVMMLYVSANVFSRYVLRMGGVDGCYMYVGKLMIPLIYLALSYGWYKKSYIVVDLLQAKLKGKVLWGFQFAFLLITLVLFSGLLAEGSLMEMISSFMSGKMAGEIGQPHTPEWPWIATVVLGFLLMAIRNLLDLITMVKTGKVISEDR